MEQFTDTEFYYLTASIDSRIHFIKQLMKDWETSESETTQWLLKHYSQEIEILETLKNKAKNNISYEKKEVA